MTRLLGIVFVASLFAAVCSMGIAVAVPDGWAAWRVGLGVFCAGALVGTVMAAVEREVDGL